MADTVDIVKIPDTIHTWDTYPLTWATAAGSDDWDSAAPFSWTMDVDVPLGATDSNTAAKGIVKDSFLETLNIVESTNKDYTLEQAVSLNILEDFSRIYNIVKGFNETITILEAPSKNIILPIDFLSRKASATFSDISIFNTPLTLTEFQDLVDSGSPAAYTQFKKFLPGDYEYRFAKVKAILTTLSNDSPVLDNLKVVVDVADIHNKGTAVIVTAATGIAVIYDTPYNSGNPNVILAFKGGVGGVATPEISSESLTGFTVKLIDDTGTYIAGSVTWASDGY